MHTTEGRDGAAINHTPHIPGLPRAQCQVPQRLLPTEQALGEVHGRPVLAGRPESDGKTADSTAELGPEGNKRRSDTGPEIPTRAHSRGHREDLQTEKKNRKAEAATTTKTQNDRKCWHSEITVKQQ